MSQLSFDLARLSRRHALALVGATGSALALGGCAPGRASAEVSGSGADGAPCTALPGETAGPFPADGSNDRPAAINVLDKAGVERVDIRASFAGLAGVAEGVPLDLEIALVDIDRGCAPLAGHAVYVWHCDAPGRYSLYDLPEQNYLRGLQVSGPDGKLRFTTIVPGCYAGRFPHIHFEVFASRAAAIGGGAGLFTSQLAIPAGADRAVYESVAAYRASRSNFADVTLTGDGAFGDNTAAQVRAQTLAMTGDPARGYRATATVGLSAKSA